MERKNYLKPISTKVEFEGMENLCEGPMPGSEGESGSGPMGDQPDTGDGPAPAAVNLWEENN